MSEVPLYTPGLQVGLEKTHTGIKWLITYKLKPQIPQIAGQSGHQDKKSYMWGGGSFVDFDFLGGEPKGALVLWCFGGAVVTDY